MKKSKSNITVYLPHIFQCRDYHEIRSIENYLSEIIPNIHVDEFCFAYGMYQGIAYIKKNSEYRLLIKELKNMQKEYETELNSRSVI